MRALVIDDSRAMRAILKNILFEAGFDVAEACDGQEGLDVLQQIESPDLILVDWNMPKMNGLEFITCVRANVHYQKIKILMVTTETEMTNVVKALELGADEYVMKPFSKEALYDKLEILGLEHDHE